MEGTDWSVVKNKLARYLGLKCHRERRLRSPSGFANRSVCFHFHMPMFCCFSDKFVDSMVASVCLYPLFLSSILLPTLIHREKGSRGASGL